MRGENSNLDSEEKEETSDLDSFVTYLVGAGSQGQWGCVEGTVVQGKEEG
jgi:hypothetical protein